jgi:hypothetical protein
VQHSGAHCWLGEGEGEGEEEEGRSLTGERGVAPGYSAGHGWKLSGLNRSSARTGTCGA